MFHDKNDTHSEIYIYFAQFSICSVLCKSCHQTEKIKKLIITSQTLNHSTKKNFFFHFCFKKFKRETTDNSDEYESLLLLTKKCKKHTFRHMWIVC